jgi:hypothetical protein
MVIVTKLGKVVLTQTFVTIMIQWSKLSSSFFAKHAFHMHKLVNALSRDHSDNNATSTLKDTPMA